MPFRYAKETDSSDGTASMDAAQNEDGDDSNADAALGSPVVQSAAPVPIVLTPAPAGKNKKAAKKDKKANKKDA